MANESKVKGNCCDSVRCHPAAQSGAVYGLGFVGAVIFFIGQATTFWMGVLGILKAMVWPAYAVYFGLLRLLS